MLLFSFSWLNFLEIFANFCCVWMHILYTSELSDTCFVDHMTCSRDVDPLYNFGCAFHIQGGVNFRQGVLLPSWCWKCWKLRWSILFIRWPYNPYCAILESFIIFIWSALLKCTYKNARVQYLYSAFLSIHTLTTKVTTVIISRIFSSVE